MIGGAGDMLQEARFAVAQAHDVERALIACRDMIAELEAIEGIEVEFRGPQTHDRDISIDIAITVLRAGGAVGHVEPDIPDLSHALREVKARENTSGDAGTDSGEAARQEPTARCPGSGNRSGAAAAGEVREPANDGRNSSEPPAPLARPGQSRRPGRNGALPYTRADARLAVAMKLEGHTNARIGDALGGRTAAAASVFVSSLRKSGEFDRLAAQILPGLETPAPVAHDLPSGTTRDPEDASPEPSEGPAPEGKAAAAPGAGVDRLRAVHAHLDRVADSAWTDEQDLAIIEGLSMGRKAVTIGADLRRPPEMIIDRFRRLCPEPTFASQEALIRALRCRLGREAA